MEDNKYNVSDLIVSATEQKPVEFQNTFNDIMVDRIATAVDNYRNDVAQNMFNGAESSEDY